MHTDPFHTSGDDTAAQDLMDLYQVTAADLEHIRACGARVTPRIPACVDLFYDWLRTRPEWEFFADPETLAHVKRRQVMYWEELFAGRVDDAYIERRRHLGATHARIGLSLPAYFAAMNRMFDIFLADLTADPEGMDAAAFSRLVHLDTALVVDAYSRIISRTLTEQSRSLMAMSTPVTAIWDNILLLPAVGIIDSKRALDMMHAMLDRIAHTRAKVFILDISGVAVVDTAVANHLIKITKATRLLGCTCTISGISPPIAQTIVELGIDVGDVLTTATLRDALAEAFRRTGIDLGKEHP